MIVQHTDIDDALAVIFDIQSFSLQDGPGIRTTVFFKGCPLRCKWCHNPESWSKVPQLMYHATLCVGCMQCVKVCPNHAHMMKELDGRLIHDIEWSKCNVCGTCLRVCNYDALSIIGETYTAARLCERLSRDMHYYSIGKGRLHGGVTFSGGEPMLYVPFMKAVRALLPDIHIAVETCGFASLEDFEELGDTVDLFLFDYKATKSETHKRLCGQDNHRILKNLDYLCHKGRDIILRLPMIPGCNDEDEHLKGIADLLKKYPEIEKGQIMPYHTLGVGKRSELGMKPGEGGDQAADEEVAQHWLSRLRELGVNNIEISK